MPQNEISSRIPIAPLKLVVELKNEFCGVERCRTSALHGEMSEGLVREKNWPAVEREQTLETIRPIDPLAEKQDAGVHRILLLRFIAKKTLVRREPAISQ